MFVGHYTASFVAKALEPRASLAFLFVAAQFLDFIFFPLVLFNVEALEMHQNATASTHFFLPFMPWSHSLWAMMIWSVLIFLLAYRLLKTSKTIAVLLALVVQTHWLFDLIVHDSDLAIWKIFSHNSINLGFGLWNNAVIAFMLECGLLIGAFFYYTKRTHANNKLGTYGPVVFLCLLLAVQAGMTFGPYFEVSKSAFAAIGLITFIFFTIIACYLDRHRQGRVTRYHLS